MNPTNVEAQIPTLGTMSAVALELLQPYLERGRARAATPCDPKEEPPSRPYEPTMGVAEISVEGPLCQRGIEFWGMLWWDGYDLIAKRINAALEDPDVDCILLSIDSPGGDAAGCFEMVRTMSERIAAAGKPVVAYCNELAASAACAIAVGLATAGVYLPPEGQIGSIGVVALHVDQSRMLERLGVKVTEVTDPEGKTTGWSPYRPLDKDGESRIREKVEAYADAFVEIVASRRGLSAAAVRALDARVYMGERAVSAGLADGVGSYQTTAARARALAGGRRSMRMSKALLNGLLGVAADASAEELEKKADEARRLLDLGREALRVTGQQDTEAAKGVLAANAEAAKKLPGVRSDLAALQAQHDTTERLKLCSEGVRRGIPAKLLYKDGDAKQGLSEWAGPQYTGDDVSKRGTGQSLAQLRAYVEAHQAPAHFEHIDADVGAAEARVSGMSSAQVDEYAKKNGIKNPVAVEAAAAMVGG